MAKLTIITGPMFSGKSEELIRVVKRLGYARQTALILKPARDTRQNSIRSRILADNGQTKTADEIPAYEVSDQASFQELVSTKSYDALIIDEAHFFPLWLADEIFKLLTIKADIYIAGLDQTAWGKNFGPMGELLAMADQVIKLTAVCFQCGASANMTFRAEAGANIVQVGDAEIYEARCRQCWQEPK
jgi:thymidine kinase